MTVSTDDDAMSLTTAWTSLVVGACSFLACTLTVNTARLCARRNGCFGWTLEMSPNLFLYLALLVADGVWGLKYIVDAALRIAEAFGSSNNHEPCQIFGFAEVLLTMARALIGTCFWVHVTVVVWGCLRHGTLERRKEWTLVRVVAFVCFLLATGVALLCLFMRWIHRNEPGAWCWFDLVNFWNWRSMAFGYGWDLLQLMLSVGGLLLPTCCFAEAKRGGVWGYHVLKAFRIRAASALIAPGVALLHLCLGYFTNRMSNRAEVMLVASAVLIPLVGLIEAAVFIASEPQVLRAMLRDRAGEEWGSAGSPHIERTGFTAAFENVFDRPARAAAAAAPYASYGAIAPTTQPLRL